MNLLWTIAEQALRYGYNAGLSPAPAGHGKWTVGLYVLAGLLATGGFIYLLIAAHTALLTLYSAPLAALLTALTAFVAAAALCGGAALMAALQQRKRQDARNESLAFIGTAMESAMEVVAAELEEPVKAYPKTAVTIAALAGMLAGERLH